MKKKSLFICVLYVLLFLIINFGTIVIFTIGYNLTSGLDVGTEKYIEDLANFLNNSKIFITLCSGLFLTPIIHKNFKMNNTKISFKLNTNYIYYILIGLTVSIILNILLYNLGFVNTDIKVPSILSVISICIIGPIIEELVFRGIIYDKLKKYFTIYNSTIIVSLLFGIYHLNIIQGIYAFFLSIVITLCYESSKNIFIPIIVHILANLSVSCFLPIIISLNSISVYVLLSIFILLFVISMKKIPLLYNFLKIDN